MTDSPLFSVSGLVSGYAGTPVLHQIELELRRGELVGILGPNGSGKSTLIRTLAGLIPILSGEVRLEGRPLASWSRRGQARRVAMVSQVFPLQFSFPVDELVEMGRYPHSGPLSRPTPRDREVVATAMRQTDIIHLARRPADELSSGELQRVIVARALAQEPVALLLDEPTSHLDLHHQLRIFELLRQFCRENRIGVLCALHDVNLAAEYCDRILLLRKGVVVAEGAAEAVITPAQLRDVYAVDADVAVNPHSLRPMMVLHRPVAGDFGNRQ